LGGAALRIDFALGNPSFDRRSSDGILATDPALLAYITDRIVEAGGVPPADFRADPNIEAPELSDVPAMFTVGQEFVVAWVALAVGDGVPLHVVAVWVMSLFAALVAVGVWGMARELCGSGAWGLAAALLWTALPTSYRTLAFVLIREDFSLPIYALHLLLMLRAVRVRSAGSFVAAGATAGLAAATWHAMGSFLLIEMACIVLWFARTRQNPFAPPRAWLGLVALLVVGLAMPVLRAKGFVLSAPVVAAVALAAAAGAARRGAGRGAELAVFGGAAVLLLGAAWALARVTGSGLYDYAHVFGFLWDKVRHLGVLPADPAELSFDSRLLWQGPFVTMPLGMLTNWLGLGACRTLVAQRQG
jgi:hypothetical protein